MVLSDRTIKEELASGHIIVEPLGERCIQPASIDIRIDRQIRVFLGPEQYSVVDVRTDLNGITKLSEIPDPLPYVLEPGQFILANTIENVELPDDVVARLEGKSSLGRLGLMVHATAGYVDPGFKGQLTLEISNIARARIGIFFGMRIGQISFLRLSTPAENPYGSGVLGSKYQGQLGPTPSRLHLDYAVNTTQHRPYPTEATELRKWLDGSEYQGSVAKLARVLGVEHKTVQDWVYGRNEPSAENRSKLFEVTGLPRYALEPGASQPRLFTDEQPQAELASTPSEDT
jgi:dCTP deaminase